MNEKTITICIAARRGGLKCRKKALKKQMCASCYDRVHKGGEINHVYKPWEKQRLKREAAKEKKNEL